MNKNKTSPDKLDAFKSYTLSLGAKKEIKLFISDGLNKDDIDFMLTWIKLLDLTKTDSLNEGNDESEK